MAGLVALGFLYTPGPAYAFPPAPHHTFVGVVRTEFGHPLAFTNATVVLEALAGTQVHTRVVPGLAGGTNYRLQVPMDAGITADGYKPNALRPALAFRMKVKLGPVTYLPLETAVHPAQLGQPAQTTRLDLTLGEDSDGDGLPDAWERALIAMLGRPATVQDLRPEDDADGDGLTNLQEYLAGTYPFDPQDGFRLDLLGVHQDRAVLELLALPGRRYAVQASPDLQTWTPVHFRLAGETDSVPLRREFSTTATRLLRLEAVVAADAPPQQQFFKAVVGTP